MAKQIVITKDNYGIEVDTVFLDDKKKPIDITGLSVEVVIVDPNNLIVDTIQATILNAVNGLASIILEGKHTSELGLYKSFWSAVDATGYVTAQEDIYYFVKDKNGGSTITEDDLVLDRDKVVEKFNEIDERIDDIEQTIEDIKEVNVNAEVIEARGNESSLDDRLDKFDASLESIEKKVKISFTDFGAKFDGITDDTKAIEDCINYALSLYPDTTFYYDGEDTNFGVDIYAPSGSCVLKHDIIINPSHKYLKNDKDNYVSGITIRGQGISATVFKNYGFIANGHHITFKDFQIQNANNDGLKLNGVANNCYNIFINGAENDGISYNNYAFKCTVSDCYVLRAKKYGFSFNSFHTSFNITSNYALECKEGGYFIGDRDNPIRNMGMVYSTINNNACDGTKIAYYLGGCRGITLNGNGAEQITNAIKVSGGNSNIIVNGFLTDKLNGRFLEVEGLNANVTLNNVNDLNAVNKDVEFISGGNEGTKITLNSIFHERNSLVNQYSTMDIVKIGNKKSKTLGFWGRTREIGELKNIKGGNGNYSGKILINVASGFDINPSLALNTTTYELLINKGAGGADLKEICYVGLKGDENAELNWGSFNFFISENKLNAMHTNPTLSSGNFTFVFEMFGEIDLI